MRIGRTKIVGEIALKNGTHHECQRESNGDNQSAANHQKREVSFAHGIADPILIVQEDCSEKKDIFHEFGIQEGNA